MRHITLFVLSILLAAGKLRAQDPVITEFMADNSKTLADKDRSFEDWIEIFNPAAVPVSLNGWSLTDSAKVPDKWLFPDVTLAAGKFLVVFASGKDRRDTIGELATNFKLSAGGGDLILVAPGGRVVSRITKYPEQVLDASSGYAMEQEVTPIVADGAAARYLVPINATLGDNWKIATLDDAAWAQGPTPIGFDHKAVPTFQDQIKTDVFSAMDNVATSLYVRVPFEVSEADAAKVFALRVRYDDGFAAFVNGVEVARRNAPTTTLRYSSKAVRERTDSESSQVEDIPLARFDGLVVAGKNLLAIQLLGSAVHQDDLFLSVEVDALTITGVDTTSLRYFATATPNFPNLGPGFPAAASRPLFSEPSGTFSGSLSLELSSVSPTAVIHYTTNGSEPTEGSDTYTAPLAITTSANVKARSYDPGLLPSGIATQGYIALNANVLAFDSNLPLVLISTFGKGISGAAVKTPGVLVVIEPPENGRAKITDPATFLGSAAWRTRGSSTGGQSKANYSMEVRDDRGGDRHVPLLGMPSESDWVLYAGSDYDIALIRNKLMYDLSNQVGVYAPRTRMVEVFTNTSNTPLASAHYMGVYTFMEKIKQGPDRVKVEDLYADSNQEPEVMGGYAFKIDRGGPGEVGFSGGGQQYFWVYPKEPQVTAQQKAWLVKYLNDTFKALSGPQFKDPDVGYAKYIDVAPTIDHHLLNVLSMNVDALRLSCYIYKARYGKVTWGPIWDFDRSINSTDSRDDNAKAWVGTGDATPFFTYPWFVNLFKDPAFTARYQHRWNELRGGPFATANINAMIDAEAKEIQEAQVRNFKKWSAMGSSASWNTDIKNMKNWLEVRSLWIDSQYIEAPSFSRHTGMVVDGADVALAVSSGDIWYTANGPDPKLATGLPAPEAVKFTDPIIVHQNTRIRARARVAEKTWSAMVEATFAISVPKLVISEIMYYPPAPAGQELQFIEVLNAGSVPVPMAGMRIADKPSFDFTGSPVATLDPGAYAVVVKNPTTFATKYGDALPVAGKYVGSNVLSRTSQQLSLVGPLGEPIFSFIYNSTWYPEANGSGRSLVLVDPATPPEMLSLKESWRPSIQDGGSPGRADVLPEGSQLPGDLNQDHRLSLGDAIGLLLHLFAGPVALPCSNDGANLALLDSDGNGTLEAADAVRVLSYLYLHGEPPASGLRCVVVTGCPTTCGQ